VWADGKPSYNDTNHADLHVNFQLARGGEAIGLFAPDGTAIDTITFGSQTANLSQGRYPDGGALITTFTNPTPRASNYLPSSNLAPTVGPLPNRTNLLGETLSFQATATDPDVPTQTLTYTLRSDAPAGASITAGGQFSWTPATNQAPSTNLVAIIATDNGTPVKSGTNTFTAYVFLPLSFGGTGTSSGTITNGQVVFTFNTIPGKSYQVWYKNLLSQPAWLTNGPPQTATGSQMTLQDPLSATNQARYYRIQQVN
jgi:hypothetical protein